MPHGTYAAGPKKHAALKGSYTVKVELWAEGTYNLRADPAQPDGLAKDEYGYHIPVALKNAKPITVNVKVNIK